MPSLGEGFQETALVTWDLVLTESVPFHGALSVQ